MILHQSSPPKPRKEKRRFRGISHGPRTGPTHHRLTAHRPAAAFATGWLTEYAPSLAGVGCAPRPGQAPIACPYVPGKLVEEPGTSGGPAAKTRGGQEPSSCRGCPALGKSSRHAGPPWDLPHEKNRHARNRGAREDPRAIRLSPEPPLLLGLGALRVLAREPMSPSLPSYRRPSFSTAPRDKNAHKKARTRQRTPKSKA